MSCEWRVLTLCCWFSFFSVVESENITCEIFLWCASNLHNDIFCHFMCKLLAKKHLSLFHWIISMVVVSGTWYSLSIKNSTDFQGEKGVEYIAKITLQLLLFWWNRQIKKNHDEFSWGILIPSNLTGYCRWLVSAQ